MYLKFFINGDDIAMCSIRESEGRIKYLSASGVAPYLVNPAETLPGKAREVTKEEFMKVANMDAVAIIENLFRSRI